MITILMGKYEAQLQEKLLDKHNIYHLQIQGVQTLELIQQININIYKTIVVEQIHTLARNYLKSVYAALLKLTENNIKVIVCSKIMLPYFIGKDGIFIYDEVEAIKQHDHEEEDAEKILQNIGEILYQKLSKQIKHKEILLWQMWHKVYGAYMQQILSPAHALQIYKMQENELK